MFFWKKKNSEAEELLADVVAESEHADSRSEQRLQTRNVWVEIASQEIPVVNISQNGLAFKAANLKVHEKVYLKIKLANQLFIESMVEVLHKHQDFCGCLIREISHPDREVLSIFIKEELEKK